MSGEMRSHVHRRGELIHTTVESAFLTASTLLFTLLTLITLYLGIWIFRAV